MSPFLCSVRGRRHAVTHRRAEPSNKIEAREVPMKTNPQHRVLVSLLAIGLSFAIAVPASAVEYPLSSTSIRDAYFLAKGNGENLGRFLLRYSHALPMPKSGPQVAVISLVTPFIQVLEHSAGIADYSAPSAVKQFSGKSLPL